MTLWRIRTTVDDRPGFLALLGDDCEVTWQPNGSAPEGNRGGVIVLADPLGGNLVVRRSGPSFTPAEYARAHALVRLAGLVGEPVQGSNR